MAETTLYWHDYETTGTDQKKDRPVQFAGIRTDLELNIIGEPLNLYAKPSRDLLFNPEASLITGITPQTALEKGICESEFMEKIHAELSLPGTCSVGYNSLRFDEEVTRNSLYRNFFDPYAREWQGGNSRWDIIDLVRVTHDLRPEGINWPKYEGGRSSFRLEDMAKANNLNQEQAHDALSDVYATLELARLIRLHQPKLFEYFFNNRFKKAIIQQIDIKGMTPLLHTSQMLCHDDGCTTAMAPICRHPTNQNAYILFDLRSDPSPLLELSPKVIHQRIFTKRDELPEGVERIPIKQLVANRCPVIAPMSTLNGPAAKKLGIDLGEIRERQQLLLQHRRQIEDKLNKVFSIKTEWPVVSDVDQRLYNGFFGPKDKKAITKIRQSNPTELSEQSWVFEDDRLQDLFFRFRARNFPETLNGDEQQKWLEHCQYRLTDAAAGGAITLTDYFSKISELRAEEGRSDHDLSILSDLESFGKDLQQSLSLT